MTYEQLSEREEEIGRAVVNAAFAVHRELGPGLLEKVYEACITHELRKSALVLRDNLRFQYSMTEEYLTKHSDWIC